MKNIFLILVCLLLVGCKQEVAQEPEEIVETIKPALLGISVIEKTVHNFIVSSKPEGKFIALNIEIANIGQSTVEITKEDVELKDKEGNIYPVHTSTSIYSKKNFPFSKIYSNEKVVGKLVFDVQDPNQEYTLTIKGRSVIVS